MRDVKPFLLVMLLGAGCNKEGTTTPPPGPEPLKAELTLSVSEPDLEAGVVSKQFDFSQIRDLWVRVKVASIPEVAALKLIFVSPQGEPFYEDNAAYSFNPQMQEMMGAPGVDVPLNVYKAKMITGGVALDRPIPIAGTVFQRYPKFGSWVVQASVSGTSGLVTSPMEVLMPKTR